MKHTIAIGLLWAVLGCGAEGFEPTEDESPEIGTLQQALTRPGYYGNLVPSAHNENFGSKCKENWSNSYRCYIPADKTLRFKNDFPVTPPAGLPDFRALFEAAVQYYQSQFSGWVIQTGGTDDNEDAEIAPAGGSVCGVFKAGCAPKVFGSFFTSGGLQYRWETRCKIRVQTDYIVWTNLTATQRETRAWNTLLHELGHCLGMGHPDFVDVPHPELGTMYTPNDDPDVYEDLTISEKIGIFAYVP